MDWMLVVTVWNSIGLILLYFFYRRRRRLSLLLAAAAPIPSARAPNPLPFCISPLRSKFDGFIPLNPPFLLSPLRAISPRSPPFCRRLRVVRRLGMLTWNEWSRGRHRQFMLFGPDGTVMKCSVVLFDHTIRGRGCQVRDRIVHRLHPDEEPIKFFQG